jgi:phospholipase D1/2
VAQFPLKTHKPAKVAIDEQTRQAKSALQFLVEHRDIKERHGDGTCPITRGNTLNFMICGEDGFKQIAKDLREAKQSADIVCWGFDPGMELERNSDTWPRGIRYGELLDEITKRKENSVTVRLLIWYDDDGSKVQNNMPGLTDVPVSRLGHPIQRYALQQDPPYKDSTRNQYCIDWWNVNLPGGKSGRGTNPRLQVILRGVSQADATALRAVAPAEEDQPVSATLSVTDEKSQLEKFATHHQKPVLIDYAYDSGSKAVGYVMGLNSVTDYWDRTAHAIDDPKREVLSDKQISDELAREVSTQQCVAHFRPAQRVQVVQSVGDVLGRAESLVLRNEEHEFRRRLRFRRHDDSELDAIQRQLLTRGGREVIGGEQRDGADRSRLPKTCIDHTHRTAG